MRQLPNEGWGGIGGVAHAVGADPGGFLVLWSGGYPAVNYATRLDVHGVPVGPPEPLELGVSSSSELVWTGSHYVMLSGTWSTRFNADGSLLDGGLPFAGGGDLPRAACDDSDCLVTFIAEGELRAVGLETDNTRTLPFQLMVSGVTGHDIVQAGEQRLAVASASDGVWSFLFDGSSEPTRSRLTTSATQTHVAVARLGDGFVVATRDDHPAADTSILVLDGAGQLISESLVSLPPEIQWASETKVLALCGGSDHAALVVGTILPGDNSSLPGERYTTAFVQQLDGAGRPLGSATELAKLGDPSLRSVACGSETILAVARGVEARTLAGRNTVLSQGPRRQMYPTLAHGSTGTLITWLDNDVETPGMMARLLDDSGAPISDEILVADMLGMPDKHVAAFDGEIFLVAWQDENSRVLAKRLDANAQVLDPTPLVLFETVSSAMPFSLASLPAGGFLAAASGAKLVGQAIVYFVEVVALGRVGDPSTRLVMDGYKNPALASTTTGAYLACLDTSTSSPASPSKGSVAGLSFDASGQPTASQPSKLEGVLAERTYPLAVVARAEELLINHSANRLVTVGPEGVSEQQTLDVRNPVLVASEVGVRAAFVEQGTAVSELLSCKGQGGRQVRIDGSVWWNPPAIVATGPSTWLLAVGDGASVRLTAIDDEGAAVPCTDSVGLIFAPSPTDVDASVADAGDSGGVPSPETFDTGAQTRIAGGEHGYLLAACAGELRSAALPLTVSMTPPALPAPTRTPAEACEVLFDLLWTGEDYLALFLRSETLFGVRLDEGGHSLSEAFKIADGFDTWTNWSAPSRVSAASNGEQVLVVFFWADNSYESFGIRAVRIELATHEVLDQALPAVDLHTNSLVAVASDGHDFAVAHALPGTAIFTRTVSSDGSTSAARSTTVVPPMDTDTLRLTRLGSGYALNWRASSGTIKSVVLDQNLQPADIGPQVLDGWVAASDEARGSLFVQGGGYARMSTALGPLTSPAVGTVTGVAQSSAGYLVYTNVYGGVTVLERIHFAPAPLGTPCRFESSCSSSLCVDGVCCDQACGDGSPRDCQACSKQRGAPADGICSALTAAAAPLQVCRPAAGPCDAPDRCLPGQAACPQDQRLGSDTVCGASKGPCDSVDRCDGSSIACIDRLQPAGWACGERAIRGACDLPDVCDGTSIECPDRMSPPGTLCRPATHACDAAERCQGGYACGKDLSRSSPECSGEPGDSGADTGGGREADADGAGEKPPTPQGRDAGPEPKAPQHPVGACSAVPMPSRPDGRLLLLVPWLLLARRQQRKAPYESR